MRSPAPLIDRNRTDAVLAPLKLWLWAAAGLLFDLLCGEERALAPKLKLAQRGVALFLLLKAMARSPARRRIRRAFTPAAPPGFRRQVTRGAVWRRLTHGELAHLRRGGAARQVVAIWRALAAPERWIARLEKRVKGFLVRARLTPAAPPAITFACDARGPRAAIADSS